MNCTRRSACLILLLLAAWLPAVLGSAEGVRSLVDYGSSDVNPLPQDLDADANGVAVLKFALATSELRLERRDRDGDPSAAEIVFSGTIPFPGGRLALGPGSEAFLLVVNPSTLNTELVRAAPFEAPTSIHVYSGSVMQSPIDVSVTGLGEVLVLKDVGSGVLTLERRNRDGVLLGPEIALVLNTGMTPLPPPTVAGGPNGRIYVLAENMHRDETGMDRTFDAIFEVSASAPAVIVAEFDPFSVSGEDPAPLDLAVDDDGNLVLLGQMMTGLSVSRVNPQGIPVGISYPVPGTGTLDAVGAGANGDFFVLTDGFVDTSTGAVSNNPALNRLTQTRAVAKLAETDAPGAPGPVALIGIATDPDGNIWTQKSLGTEFALLEHLDRTGNRLGAELFLPFGPVMETMGWDAGISVAGNGAIFTNLLLRDGPAELEPVLLSVTPTTPAVILTAFGTGVDAPDPLDLTLDSNANLALLMQNTMAIERFVEWRSTDGTSLGSEGPLPGSGFRGRVALGTQGEVYALVDDAAVEFEDIVFRVQQGQTPAPIISFPFTTSRYPLDISSDENGNPLVLIAEMGLNQVVIERRDPNGSLLEIAAAVPAVAGFTGSRLEAGTAGDLYVLTTAPFGMMRRVIYRSAELVDSDQDGILDDGNASGLTTDAACFGGNSVGCDDNCRLVENPEQLDSGGVASPSNARGLFPDGVGDSCQCGDVNGDGIVNRYDVIEVRLDLVSGLPAGDVRQPSFCNVIGPADPTDGPDNDNLPDDCNVADVAVLIRNLYGLSPLVAQVCTPATLGL